MAISSRSAARWPTTGWVPAEATPNVVRWGWWSLGSGCGTRWTARGGDSGRRSRPCTLDASNDYEAVHAWLVVAATASGQAKLDAPHTRWPARSRPCLSEWRI